eukprot:10131717-Alexandrium_andersonii.AAC.1
MLSVGLMVSGTPGAASAGTSGPLRASGLMLDLLGPPRLAGNPRFSRPSCAGWTSARIFVMTTSLC